MERFDVETPNFRISTPTDMEFSEYLSSPHILTLNKGERVYEARSYPSRTEKILLIIISKIREDGMVMPLIKFKYPDRVSSFGTEKWHTKEEYEEVIGVIEEGMSLGFDTTNPLVIPGRHINLYLKGRPEKEGS